MADKLQLLLEAEKRGLLPPDKKAMLDEARKRGLVNDNSVHDDDLKAMMEPAAPQHDANGNEIVPDTSTLAGLPLPGKVSQAEANGQVKDFTPQHFGTSSADTLNPVPAIAALGDQMFGNVPIAGPYLQQGRDQLNAKINGGTPEQARADINETVRQNPEAATIGTAAGKTLPYVAAATVGGPVAAALGLEGSLGLRLLMGGLSSEAINVGDRSAHGESPTDAVIGGTRDTAMTLPLFALGPRGARWDTVANAPTVATLRNEAGQLYKATEDSQLIINRPAADRWINDTTSRAMSGGLDQDLTPQSNAVIRRLQEMTGRNMSIQDAMLARRLATDAVDTAKPGSNDARIAGNIVRDLDGFLEDATRPGSTAVLSGDAKAAHQSLTQANATWAAAQKGRILDQTIELATERAQQSGGLSLDQALRNEFGNLDRQIIKGDVTGFTPREVAMIRRVSRGTAGRNIAKYIGKFAPAGVISAGVGGTIGHYLGGGDPVKTIMAAGGVLGTGAAGRTLANGMARSDANYASAATRTGPFLGQGGTGGNVLGGGGQAPSLSAVPAQIGRTATTMTLDQWSKQNSGAQMAPAP